MKCLNDLFMEKTCKLVKKTHLDYPHDSILPLHEGATEKSYIILDVTNTGNISYIRETDILRGIYFISRNKKTLNISEIDLEKSKQFLISSLLYNNLMDYQENALTEVEKIMSAKKAYYQNTISDESTNTWMKLLFDVKKCDLKKSISKIFEYNQLQLEPNILKLRTRLREAYISQGFTPSNINKAKRIIIDGRGNENLPEVYCLKDGQQLDINKISIEEIVNYTIHYQNRRMDDATTLCVILSTYLFPRRIARMRKFM